MKKKTFQRSDFFFVFGIINLFLVTPFIFQILNSAGATTFIVWDYVTIFLISIINFVFFPLLAFIIVSFLNKLPNNLKSILISLFISYIIVIQLSFYIISNFNLNFNISLSFILFPIISLILFKIYNKVYMIFGMIGVFTPIFIIIFFIISNTNGNYVSNNTNLSFRNKTSDIFIITAEKITAPLILEKNFRIRSDFPNLKELSKASTIFTNLHAQTIGTLDALQAILLGK